MIIFRGYKLLFVLNQSDKDFECLIKKYNTGKQYINKKRLGLYDINIKEENTDQSGAVDKI